MRLASLPLAALASLSLLLAAPAQAALLVDPVGGTPVTFDDADEGSSEPVNLGFSFNFFGTNYSQVYVNTNGNLTFGGANPSGFNTRLGEDVTFPLIAVACLLVLRPFKGWLVSEQYVHKAAPPEWESTGGHGD